MIRDMVAQTQLLLGVDGGGSKTIALLADAKGKVLGRGSAGTANHFTVGKEQACAAIEQAVAASFAEAGLGRTSIAALCFGLAGVDRPDNRALFEPWIAQQFPDAKASLVNDAELVLAAGTPEGWGIALICGTGVIVMGCNRQGERGRVDGWGYLLGDQGSGFSIGLAALQSVMAAHDGRGAPTLLSQMVLQHCNLNSPLELVRWTYRERVPTAEIASLTRLVDAAAEQGDNIAQTILHQAADQLAHTVQTLVKKLGFESEVPCALAGGVITNNQQISRSFNQALERQGIVLQPVAVVHEPALGAVRIAVRLLNKKNDQQTV